MGSFGQRDLMQIMQGGDIHGGPQPGRALHHSLQLAGTLGCAKVSAVAPSGRIQATSGR